MTQLRAEMCIEEGLLVLFWEMWLNWLAVLCRNVEMQFMPFLLTTAVGDEERQTQTSSLLRKQLHLALQLGG